MIIIANDIKLRVKASASDVTSRSTVIWINQSDEPIEPDI